MMADPGLAPETPAEVCIVAAYFLTLLGVPFRMSRTFRPGFITAGIWPPTPQVAAPARDRGKAILWITAIILGIVEGITEFLPVSSTGHLIVAGYYLNFEGPLAVTFEIVIQLGAILAVIFYFRKTIVRLFREARQPGPSRSCLTGIGIAFLPVAVVGLAVHESIEQHLFHPLPVALALIAGGVAILLIEHFCPPGRIQTLTQVRPYTAFTVGLAQVLALVPGVSRSGATILGGLLAGMKREVATEFSFFLSIPTMLAATGYHFLTHRHLFAPTDLIPLGLGLGVSFGVALVVVAAFLRYVRTHTFRPFGYYRILFGISILILMG